MYQHCWVPVLLKLPQYFSLNIGSNNFARFLFLVNIILQISISVISPIRIYHLGTKLRALNLITTCIIIRNKIFTSSRKSCEITPQKNVHVNKMWLTVIELQCYSKYKTKIISRWKFPVNLVPVYWLSVILLHSGILTVVARQLGQFVDCQGDNIESSFVVGCSQPVVTCCLCLQKTPAVKSYSSNKNKWLITVVTWDGMKLSVRLISSWDIIYKYHVYFTLSQTSNLQCM